jgi:hypothetical protein
MLSCWTVCLVRLRGAGRATQLWLVQQDAGEGWQTRWGISTNMWRRRHHHRLPPRRAARPLVLPLVTAGAGRTGGYSSWSEPTSTSSCPVTIASGPLETNGKLRRGGRGQSADYASAPRDRATAQFAPSPASHRSRGRCAQDGAGHGRMEARESAGSGRKTVREVAAIGAWWPLAR